MRMRVLCRRPDVRPSREGAFDLCSIFRENATNILTLPAEYVAAFSRRTEAPEVRYDLTDRQTDGHTDTATTVTLAAHARGGLIQGGKGIPQHTPLTKLTVQKDSG